MLSGVHLLIYLAPTLWAGAAGGSGATTRQRLTSILRLLRPRGPGVRSLGPPGRVFPESFPVVFLLFPNLGSPVANLTPQELGLTGARYQQTGGLDLVVYRRLQTTEIWAARPESLDLVWSGKWRKRYSGARGWLARILKLPAWRDFLTVGLKELPMQVRHLPAPGSGFSARPGTMAKASGNEQAPQASPCNLPAAQRRLSSRRWAQQHPGPACPHHRGLLGLSE